MPLAVDSLDPMPFRKQRFIVERAAAELGALRSATGKDPSIRLLSSYAAGLDMSRPDGVVLVETFRLGSEEFEMVLNLPALAGELGSERVGRNDIDRLAGRAWLRLRMASLPGSRPWGPSSALPPKKYAPWRTLLAAEAPRVSRALLQRFPSRGAWTSWVRSGNIRPDSREPRPWEEGVMELVAHEFGHVACELLVSPELDIRHLPAMLGLADAIAPPVSCRGLAGPYENFAEAWSLARREPERLCHEHPGAARMLEGMLGKDGAYESLTTGADA